MAERIDVVSNEPKFFVVTFVCLPQEVSHLAKAILLNLEETDMSRVIDMIHQKGN